MTSVVAGRPVRFVGAETEEDNQYAENRLRDAFALAGLRAAGKIRLNWYSRRRSSVLAQGPAYSHRATMSFVSGHVLFWVFLRLNEPPIVPSA
jgi:hypothetical protein